MARVTRFSQRQPRQNLRHRFRKSIHTTSTSDNGTDPNEKSRSWNARKSKAWLAFFSARRRNSRIFSPPTLAVGLSGVDRQSAGFQGPVTDHPGGNDFFQLNPRTGLFRWQLCWFFSIH